MNESKQAIGNAVRELTAVIGPEWDAVAGRVTEQLAALAPIARRLAADRGATPSRVSTKEYGQMRDKHRKALSSNINLHAPVSLLIAGRAADAAWDAIEPE